MAGHDEGAGQSLTNAPYWTLGAPILKSGIWGVVFCSRNGVLNDSTHASQVTFSEERTRSHLGCRGLKILAKSPNEYDRSLRYTEHVYGTLNAAKPLGDIWLIPWGRTLLDVLERNLE